MHTKLIVPCLLAALAPAQTTLIGEWRGDGNARDSSARCINTPALCNHGMASAGVRYNDKSVRGGAFYVQSNQQVSFGTPLRFVSDLSIEFWFRVSHASGASWRLVSSAPNTTSSWSVAVNQGSLEIRHGAGIGQPIRLGVSRVAANRWYHIVLTRRFDSNSVRLDAYLDGTHRTSTSLNSQNVQLDSPGLVIPSSNPFRQHIDEIRLYAGAMTRAEALARYQDFVGTVRPFGANSCTTRAGQRATVALTPTPKPGQTSTLALTGGRNGSIASFVLGTQKLATPLPVLGCDLLVRPAAIALPQFAWGPTTTRNIPLRIPNDDCLLGKTVFLQGIVIDPPIGVTLSAGLEVTVGV